MLLKSETPERVKKTAQNGSIFVVFLAIFISFFSTANSVMASEVTGDLSTGLIGSKVLNTVNSTSSTSSSSSSNNSAPSCGDAKPASIPDLFQINTNSTTAKLFFTPINNTSQFYVSFSENTNAEEHGELVTLLREGVQGHTIYYLKPNTSYYLKVRGQNGCMPGDWSNIMKITTRFKGITKTAVFYKKTNIIKKVTETPTSELIPTIITPTKVTETPTPEPIPTITTQIKSNTPTPPVIIKKRCFLWWCW